MKPGNRQQALLAEMVPIHTKRIALADERKESTMTMPFCSLAGRLLFCPFRKMLKKL